MTKSMKTIAICITLMGLLLGCGPKDETGTAFESFDPKEAEAKARLGEAEKKAAAAGPSPSVAALGGKSPTAAAPTTAKPTQVLTLRLVHDDPYFELEGQPVNDIVIGSGTQLKIINADERSRSVVISALGFDTGELETGEQATFTATTKGKFQVEDTYAPFVTANLQVS